MTLPHARAAQPSDDGRTRHGVPPVFLDRDGTLILEKAYLGDPGQVCLEHGVVEGLTMLRAREHPLIVLSNQSGIGRHMITEADSRRVNARIGELLLECGIEILAWYVCPHAPEALCACRKPSAGLAIAAAGDWNLKLAGSYVIGDKRSDLELADAIGGTGILVTTGHGAKHAAWAVSEARPVFDGLPAAADYILCGSSGAGFSGASS